MRKKFMIATAGIAAAMVMATGCSSKAPAETTPSQTEAAAGTTEAQTDSQGSRDWRGAWNKCGGNNGRRRGS